MDVDQGQVQLEVSTQCLVSLVAEQFHSLVLLHINCPASYVADALCISTAPFSILSAVKHSGHCHELVDHAVTSALPPRQLPLRDLAFQPIRGHTHPILHVSTHHTQPLAITVDSAGSAMLWDLTTLSALGLVSDLLQGSGEDPVQVAYTLHHHD